MSRHPRNLLISGAAAAALLSLSLSGVAAQEAEADEMASMEPMAEMEPGLHVREPWARVSPMVELAGAAYLVIHNNTDADDALVGASSEAAEFVELHLSSMDEEGMMSMQQVTEIAVPAHGDAVLKPGSYHVMLINLVEPLTADTELELTLEFMTAEPQTVVVPVLDEPPMMMDDMGDMGEGMGHDMDMEEDTEEGS